MTAMTAMMMTTIAMPVTIESMGAVVLMPHLTCHGFDIIVITKLSCIFQKCVNAHTFEPHLRADICACILGQDWRDDGVNGIIVGNSCACGNVHRGRSGTDDADNVDGDADDILY